MNWFELIKEILGSTAGSFGFVVFCLMLLGWVIYKITKFTTTWNMKEKGFDKLESKVDDLTSEVSYIKTQLNIFINNAGGFVQSHSPIGLSELGKRTAEEMGINSILANNWDSIFDYIDKNVESKNAYDIQQFCIETSTINLDKIISKQDLEHLKMFAYNQGKPLALYGSMIGVLIRDKYFQQKGINPAAVDEHEPKDIKK